MILDGVGSFKPAPHRCKKPPTESTGHGRMKDRPYYMPPPWLLLSMVALTINCGLWLSAHRIVSRHEASSVEASATLESGDTIPTGAPLKNGNMCRGTGRAKAPPTTHSVARWQGDLPARLPQCGANEAWRVQRLPPSSPGVLVGLDQIGTQVPRLEFTSFPHRAPVLTPLPAWGLAGLQPAPNRDPTETRIKGSLAEVPPHLFTVASAPLEVQRLPQAGRSRNMELMAREADGHTRRGFELTGRGAIFSARAEFVAALRLVAQARDEDRRGTECGRALAAGLTALEEAEGFLPQDTGIGVEPDLPDIIRGNETPVLRDVVLDNLSAHAAVRCYFSFAQEQLAASAGSEVAGSMALYGLGRLHGSIAQRRDTGIRAALPKSVLFHQAALLVMPRNHLAANDLGVLLARGGRHEDARVVMEHGLAVNPSSVGLRNLGLVLWKLDRTESSRQVHQRYLAYLEAERRDTRHGSDSSVQAVRWVDPASFAKRGDGQPNVRLEQQPSLETARQAYRPSRTDAGRGATEHRAKDSAMTAPVVRPGILSKEGAAAGSSSDVIAGVYVSHDGTSREWHANVRQPVLQEAAEPAQAAAEIRLCQALGPAAPCNICGVDCSGCDACGSRGWESMRAVAWQAYAQGEYVGHERLAHVPEYRLRVDDELDLIYRLTREEQREPYKLNVGDEIRVESFTDEALTRDLLIQPDGTITVRLLGQVRATGKTVTQLTEDLEALYQKFYNVPAITVTPLKVNTKLEDLRATVDRRQGFGGQTQTAKVTPEGTIALSAIGHVKAQGLTLSELQRELNERYRVAVNGMEVIPALVQRAPRYVYVLGEVAGPGRFELTGPTTVLQALAMAGSWNVGAHLKQVVIFRRGDDWRLLATMVDLHGALHGKEPCPAGEIWLSDSDVVIVPKSPILVADDFINLVFTRGVYGVFPMSASLSLTELSSL